MEAGREGGKEGRREKRKGSEGEIGRERWRVGVRAGTQK